MKRSLKADARARILRAAERQFAEAGFAATSVRDIVEATGYSKPTLYYYFGSKEGLFRAILDHAHDECSALMERAATSRTAIGDQLVDVLAALFEFLRDRRDLIRLAFASAFAAPGELPKAAEDEVRRQQHFEFFHRLVKKARKDGRLSSEFDSRELSSGVYGALSFYLMANLLLPGFRLNRRTARRVVDLYLKGAAA